MKLKKWIPSILWMGFMYYLSSQQTTVIKGDADIRFYLLKSFHLIEYAILATLLYFANQKVKLSIIIAYLFSLSDEYHQTFVAGRTGRFFDTFYDLIGIIIGIYLTITFLTYLKKYHHKLD